MAKRASDSPSQRKTSKKPTTRKSEAQSSTRSASQPQSASPQKAPTSTTQRKMASTVSSVTHDMIAQRAYDLWREQGGSDMENWLKAERELRSQNIAST